MISLCGGTHEARRALFFRYKLEDRDKTWEDAGARRQAFTMIFRLAVIGSASRFMSCKCLHIDRRIANATSSASFLRTQVLLSREASWEWVENSVFWPQDSRYEQVEMIFGESKSGAALNPAERTKLRAFAGKTGSYLCFCTLAEDFSEDDKTFFRELVEAKIGVIMLNRFFLEEGILRTS